MQFRRFDTVFASEEYLGWEMKSTLKNIKWFHRLNCNSRHPAVYYNSPLMYVQGNCLYLLHLIPTSLIKIVHKIYILCRTIERSYAIVWKRLERTWIENPRSNFDEEWKENFLTSRVFSIALYIYIYISFLVSLLNIRDIYKIISESWSIDLSII